MLRNMAVVIQTTFLIELVYIIYNTYKYIHIFGNFRYSTNNLVYFNMDYYSFKDS